MTIRVLCAADIHLGRELWQLPDDMQFGPVFAWNRLIDYALTEKVDALVLAGDLLDNDEDFFEAYFLLEKGLKKLEKMPLIVVGGNHDAKIFGKLKKDNLYLLGRHGNWESRSFEIKGRRVRFDGCSFVPNYMPFESYNLSKPENDEIAIGVLHCDVDGNRVDGYGVVSLNDFKKLPQKAWVLGHLHKPTQYCEDPLVFYCGSLVGLDITETGIHGASLLEIDSSVSRKEVLSSPLRWEILEIDLSLISPEDWENGLISKINELKEENKELVLRVILKGRCSFYKELKKIKWPTFVESVEDLSQPDFDLGELAKGEDLIAILAQSLVNLKSGQAEELILGAQEKLLKHSLTTEDIKVHLFKSGYALLEALILQKEV